MKTVQITRYGGPEVLDVVDMPMTAPAPGQVQVRAHAIGVGMPDVLLRSGRYPWAPPLPSVPGIEMSGRVSALGTGVGTLQVGDPVLVSARELPVRGGCYAQAICVPEEAVYRLPDTVDLDEAACLSNYQVAWHLLYTAVNGMRCDSVLVWAAAGGVGTALTQLAKLDGKTIIGVASGEDKCAFTLAQGAHACIDRKTEDIGQRIKELTDGRGVDLIFDCVGGPFFSQNIGYLAPLGLVVNYGLIDGLPDPSYLADFHERLGDSLAVRMFSMHLMDRDRLRRRAGMQAVIDLLEQGQIKPRIAQRLKLDEARRAHEILEGGRELGKLLLRP